MSDGKTAPTIKANRNGEPGVAYSINHADMPLSVCTTGYTASQYGQYMQECGTLRANGGDLGGGSETLVCYAIQGNGVDRDIGQNGGGWREDQMYTLNTIDRPAVIYDARGNGDGRTAPTITGDHENRVTDYTAIVANSSGGGKAATLDASYYKGSGARNGNEREFLVQKSNPPRKYIVRRLTPLECCRLQGFPDWWEDGVKGSDSERYKMWGNGIALPCAADVLRRVAKAARETEE